ncbi:MAG: hypothetical protein ACE5KM_15430 [Planctomycetaceae bacterium]
MRRLLPLSLVAALVASTSSASAAGGLFQTLPKDGTWTRYYMEMKSERPMQMMTGTFTLRSVGSVTENGEKCRWVEMQMEGERDGKKEKGAFKFLVKEKDFKPGSKSVPEIVRGWIQNKADGEVKELTDQEKSPDGMMVIFFGGHRKDVKKLKKEKVIDYQKGQLKITTGTTGTLELKPAPNAPAGFKYTVTQSVWPHKNVPFGTAAMEVQMEIKIKDMIASKMKMTFSVQDHGTGGEQAKSALPDKK